MMMGLALLWPLVCQALTYMIDEDGEITQKSDPSFKARLVRCEQNYQGKYVPESFSDSIYLFKFDQPLEEMGVYKQSAFIYLGNEPDTDAVIAQVRSIPDLGDVVLPTSFPFKDFTDDPGPYQSGFYQYGWHLSDSGGNVSGWFHLDGLNPSIAHLSYPNHVADGCYVPVTFDTDLGRLKEVLSSMDPVFLVQSLRLQDTDQDTMTPEGRDFGTKLLKTFQELRRKNHALRLFSHATTLYFDALDIKDLSGAVPGLHGIIVGEKEKGPYLNIQKNGSSHKDASLKSIELRDYVLDEKDTVTLYTILSQSRGVSGSTKGQTDVVFKNCVFNASNLILEQLQKELSHPSVWWWEIAEKTGTHYTYPPQRCLPTFVSLKLSEMSSNPSYLMDGDWHCLNKSTCEQLDPRIWKVDVKGISLNDGELSILVNALHKNQFVKELSLTLPYWGSDASRVLEWGFGGNWQNRKTLKEQAAYLLKWTPVVALASIPCALKDGVSYMWGNREHYTLFRKLATIPKLGKLQLELQGSWHDPERIQGMIHGAREKAGLLPLELTIIDTSQRFFASY